MKSNIIFGIILVLGFIYVKYANQSEQDYLDKNKLITNGQIKEFRKSSVRSSFPPEYFYRVNGKYYSGTLNGQDPCKSLDLEVKKLIRSKWFPVLYSSEDPSISRMLIRPQDFKDFGLNFPDTLNQMYLLYFKDCEDDLVRVNWNF